MNKLFLLLALLVSVSCSQGSGNLSNDSFSKSKRLLAEDVFSHRTVTIYCGCNYSEIDGKLKPDLEGCGYIPKGSGVRANRIEWEHVVPAHDFGQSFPEWDNGHPDCVTSSGKTYKGRRCVEKVQPAYRFMQADMHNLHPAIGEVNGYRRDYPVAIIPGEEREFGSCDVEIKSQQMEPREEVRGDIARTYFYMEESYPGSLVIPSDMKDMLRSWDNADAPSEWECEKERLVAAIQGNSNHFVRERCEGKKGASSSEDEKQGEPASSTESEEPAFLDLILK
jgi:deoxyribonuclease-1